MWLPYLCQDFSKYEIMKKLARTLSLFLIFSENFYKSKVRNLMTELCYYLQFCRSETDCQFRIHCLIEAVCYLTFSSTRPPPAIVRPLQVKFELQLIWRPKFSGFMQAIPWFVSLWQKTHQMAENSPNGRKLTKWQKTHQVGEKPTKSDLSLRNICHYAISGFIC